MNWKARTLNNIFHKKNEAYEMASGGWIPIVSGTMWTTGTKKTKEFKEMMKENYEQQSQREQERTIYCKPLIRKIWKNIQKGASFWRSWNKSS